jgi:hypothetical protein
MGLLRGIGYFFAALILIGGIVLFFVFPPAGIPPIVGAIVIMYILHKGAQVKTIRDDIRALRELQEENARKELDNERRDALRKQSELNEQKYIKLDNWSLVDKEELK